MRMARAFTGRDKVLKFEGAYHGNHDYSSFSLFPTKPANYPAGTSDSGGVPQVLQADRPDLALQQPRRGRGDRAREPG